MAAWKERSRDLVRDWLLFVLAHVLMHGAATALRLTGHEGFWFFLWCVWLPFACFQFFWLGALVSRRDA